MFKFFTDAEEGIMNTFDFVLVVATYIFIVVPDTGGTSVAALRMVRLIRIFKVLRKVKELRVILKGLNEGLKSVASILAIMLLTNYIFAVAGVVLFKNNDPSNFGSMPAAMLASWNSRDCLSSSTS